MAKSELIIDALLFILENFPQLIIQIIYGVYTGDANPRSIAWYLALFFTSFHTLTQFFGVVKLALQLPELYDAYREGYGKPDDEFGAITVKED